MIRCHYESDVTFQYLSHLITVIDLLISIHSMFDFRRKYITVNAVSIQISLFHTFEDSSLGQSRSQMTSRSMHACIDTTNMSGLVSEPVIQRSSESVRQ